MSGNSDVIRALVQEGCELDRQDKDGNTALHEAAWHGFSQCVKLLVKNGANVHAKNKQPGHTALHLACQNGHAHSSKVLLLGGSRPDAKNHGGDTCLHVAARYNHTAVVSILLGAFCSVSERNLAGDTALHVAAAQNHKKIVRVLLEAGAEHHVCNNAGETPLDQAREHNNPDVALLLSKAPKVQTFVRGRSVRKRRDKLKVQGRAQSVPREETLPCEDGASATDDSHKSEKAARNGATQSNAARQENGKQKKRSREPSGKKKSQVPGASVPPHKFKAYQLYTLYRDKDGQIMQAPLNGCRCEPLINKLENQLKATKEEMRSEIHSLKDLMNVKMGELDQRNQHQICSLDKKTLERVSAAKRQCQQRMEQQLQQEQLKLEKRQAALLGELKSWCLSKLQNSAELDTTRLPSGPSGLEGPGDVPEPPAAHRGNPNLEGGGCRDPAEDDEASSNHYFVVRGENSQHAVVKHKAEVSPADLQGASKSVQVVRPKERRPTCDDAQWKNLQDTDVCAARKGRGYRTSSLSPPAQHRRSGRRLAELRDEEELGRDKRKRHRKASQVRSKSSEATGVRTQVPEGPDPDWDKAQALEVTHYFFEAVSTQMEQWYERKLREAHRQADQRAQADRDTLVQRIALLEEELRVLRTDRDDGC